jgi:hypothetical protein
MSSCIYHDFEAVAICPSCDFGVCQTCLDEGENGVCSTCMEEQRSRDAARVVKSQDEMAEGRRCHYCRVAEDAETRLDYHGYCETCAVLNRCHVHEEAIAIGHCKSCRREYCRKCLGFADVCQTCTAQKKTKPLQAPAQPAAKSGSAKPVGKKSEKTAATKAPVATASRTERKPLGKTETAAKAASGGIGIKAGGLTQTKDVPGGSGASGEGKLRLKQEPANEASAKPAARRRLPMVLGASVLLVVGALIYSGVLLGGAPAGKTLPMDEQMKSVHRGVVGFTRKYRRIPHGLSELQEAVNLELGQQAGISLSTKKTTLPKTVIYQQSGNGYVITATDEHGGPVINNGIPIRLDQYSDTSNQ